MGDDGCVWWITGRPSAGKTFTGDYLEASCGFTHVEGDWRMHSPLHRQVTDGLVKSFYQFWFKDKDAPEELWQPYYGEVCTEAKEALNRDPRKPVVVTLALYRKKVREYVGKQLKGVRFILLEISDDEAARRMLLKFKEYLEVTKTKAEAYWKGQGLETKYGPYSDENYMLWQKQTSMHGLEPFSADEKQSCFVVNADKKDDSVLDNVRRVLGLAQRRNPIDLNAIKAVNNARYLRMVAKTDRTAGRHLFLVARIAVTFAAFTVIRQASGGLQRR
uniref:Sulfotransferase domain-containing protein n=1 Tax=Lotharella globosa TaxID=91324 RepID=A0A7S4DWZ3_9EUKA|mmetsp:Transcript_7598/g.14113  ORF Transcript_7598/g.14113 Transcript_7598/m.14113 type:complete len:275 (+) Transcript_7598:54-878(+)